MLRSTAYADLKWLDITADDFVAAAGGSRDSSLQGTSRRDKGESVSLNVCDVCLAA